MKLTHDGSLTNDLAEVVGFLRVKAYASIARQAEAAVRSSAEGFVSKLAEHLRFEEEVLFPTLLRVAPHGGDGLERLKEQHELLRLYARDLACRIAGRDDAGAYGVSRAFLVALMDHVEEEARFTDFIVRGLDAKGRQELEAALDRAHPHAEDTEGPDLVDPPCGT